MGSTLGLADGTLGAGILGILIGVIIGLGYSYRRDKARTGETIDDYPEELERVERRHGKQDVVLVPTFMIAGMAISWIIFGTGWYGLGVALFAIGVTSWALGRFGGPSDPKWKRVRDDWERKA